VPPSLDNRPSLIAVVMALMPSRLGRAACPGEIEVIDPPLSGRAPAGPARPT
jgi:hypothetical protein